MSFTFHHHYSMDDSPKVLPAALLHTAENPLYVVFPSAITTYAFEAAETLSEYIRNVTGIAPVRTCDPNVPRGHALICLGDVRVPANEALFEDLHYGECKFAAGDSFFSAATWTDENLVAVVDNLITGMSFEADTLNIFLDLPEERYQLPGYAYLVPHYDGGSLAAYRHGTRGATLFVISGTNADEYEQFLAKCQEEGFVFYCRTQLEDNIFTRLTLGGASLYAYYTPFNKTVRIIAEPDANVHEDSIDDSCRCKPLMTVIGARFSDTNKYLNCDAGSGNMGYVFRLEDGRFVIVDGGMELGDYAEKILYTMREQRTGTGKMKIACWFLSHTHIDHTGAFLKIAEKYGDQVEIEEIAANFPSIREAEAHREAWNIRRVSEAAYRIFPDARYVRPHTGEIFDYGNAEVEILYTQEDLVKQYFSVLNDGYTWNTSSICLRIKIGGNTVILPADCDEQANAIMTQMYGTYLKSDVLQVCHHGGWGGSTEFYSKIDPELAIFSTSDELLPKYLQIKYNHDLVYDMHVKEVHNNADRCRTFELPYHPARTVLPPDPKEEILYTKAKQLEALAQIENLKKEQL